jgi:RNA polymerase sigma factor (sigma-70 family)
MAQYSARELETVVENVLQVPSRISMWRFYSFVEGDVRRLAAYQVKAWRSLPSSGQAVAVEELMSSIIVELIDSDTMQELGKDWLQARARGETIDGCVSSFLKRIVSRVAKRQQREESARRTATLTDVELQEVAHPMEGSSVEVSSAAVRETLSRLSPDDRDLLRMLFIRELSVADVAENLKVDYSTAATRLWRAKNRFKIIFEEIIQRR